MHYQPLVAAGLIAISSSLVAGQESTQRTLNIVAHQDDDLLFLNPQIIQDIDNGRAIRTVYLTAGDNGQGVDYWSSRQAGALAAYAEMAGVENNWDESDIGVPDKDIPLYTLRDAEDISVAFLHIPDGNIGGNGFDGTGNESLEKLWNEEIEEIRTVDESGTTYTREDLVETLIEIINDYEPDFLNTQNYIDDFDTGDHSDHVAGALFANDAAENSEFDGPVIAYEGYQTEGLPSNVLGEDLEAKKAAFYTYAALDSAACASDEGCSGSEYELWLTREYPVN